MLSFGLVRAGHFSRKNNCVFDGVRQVTFVKVKAGFPFLAGAVTEIFHEFCGGVAKMNRDGFIASLTCEVESGVPGFGGGAGFFTESESDGSMGKHKAGLWHADTLDGLEAGGGERKSTVTSETDVFGGEDNHSSGNELRIFASFDHACEVIKRSINIGATHGFDEGRNGVVMIIAFFVIAGEFLAGGFFGNFAIDFGGKRGGEF